MLAVPLMQRHLYPPGDESCDCKILCILDFSVLLVANQFIEPSLKNLIKLDQIPLSLTCCVTLSWPFHCSQAQFLHMSHEEEEMTGRELTVVLCECLPTGAGWS